VLFNMDWQGHKRTEKLKAFVPPNMFFMLYCNNNDVHKEETVVHA